MAEGIPVDLVEFSDNRPVLDMLLSKPMGLLALLDEESRFPRATNRSLIGEYFRMHYCINVFASHYFREEGIISQNILEFKFFKINNKTNKLFFLFRKANFYTMF